MNLDAVHSTAGYYDSFWKRLAHSNVHPSNVFRYELISGILAGTGREFDCMIDLGCGSSSILDYLRQSVTIRKYIGFDVSPFIVAACNSKGRKNCEYFQADLQKSLDDKYLGTADVAISCEVIEHLEDYLPLLRSAGRVLKKGGVMVLTTPSGPLHRLEVELFGHIRHFDRDRLAQEVAEQGFRILKKFNCGFPMLNLERWIASFFVDRIKESLSKEFEQTTLFKVANVVVGCGMRLSSKTRGCQLVIVGEKI